MQLNESMTRFFASARMWNILFLGALQLLGLSQRPPHTPSNRFLCPTKPSLVGVVGNAVAGAVVTALVGGGAFRHFENWSRRNLLHVLGDEETTTISRKNELTDALLKVGLGGATAAGVGKLLHRRKSLAGVLEDRNAKSLSSLQKVKATHRTELLHLEQALASRELKLNETKKILLAAESSLQETQSSLRELQTLYESQYSCFLGSSLAMMLCIVALVILGLNQRLTHQKERHKLTITHNTEREHALQEKLQQQQTSLNDALEERKLQVQLAQSMRALQPSLPPPPSSSFHHQGQPIIFQLPTGLGMAGPSRVAPTAFAEVSQSGFSVQEAC